MQLFGRQVGQLLGQLFYVAVHIVGIGSGGAFVAHLCYTPTQMRGCAKASRLARVAVVGGGGLLRQVITCGWAASRNSCAPAPR